MFRQRSDSLLRWNVESKLSVLSGSDIPGLESGKRGQEPFSNFYYSMTVRRSGREIILRHKCLDK